MQKLTCCICCCPLARPFVSSVVICITAGVNEVEGFGSFSDLPKSLQTSAKISSIVSSAFI